MNMINLYCRLRIAQDRAANMMWDACTRTAEIVYDLGPRVYEALSIGPLDKLVVPAASNEHQEELMLSMAPSDCNPKNFPIW